ncbi:MAG TPA: hypothetical protein H9881_08425 [Candidatus Stackebrandtia excrementipullorum]|nr:hypothetical protein [Candidatus Stackebrandtia excrementipullorum]
MRGKRWPGLFVAGTAVVTLVGGCGELPTDEPVASRNESTSSTDSEIESMESAAEAGGICELLDFGPLSDATGDGFSIARAGGEGEVTSCVVMTLTGSFPDVTLTKARTATDVDTYRAEIPPEKADDVDDLGKAAYSALRKAIDGSGPIVEIGWLTDGHMYSLRYTSAEGSEKETVRETVDALVEIARTADELAAAEDDAEK